MLYDRFVFSVCIIALILSGFFASLIFQGVDLVNCISLLANLSTIGGFCFAVYVFLIWKNQRKLEFLHSKILQLQQDVITTQSSWGQAVVLVLSKHKTSFYESAEKIFELDKSLRDVISTFEIATGKSYLPESFHEQTEIEHFKDVIIHLRALTVTERNVTNSSKSDVEIMYLAIAEPEKVTGYIRSLKSYFINVKIDFNKINKELDALRKAL